MPDISRTAQLLKYFAQQYQGATRTGIERTRLMKMAYLSDLLAREHLESPITDFKYVYWSHGPYDEKVRSYVDELRDNDLGKSVVEYGDDFSSNRLLDVGGPIPFEFTPEEMEILQYVSRTYLHMPLKALLYDVVYETRPMKEAKKKKPLDMDVVNGAAIAITGFTLADVLEAEQQIANGRFVTEI